MSTKIALDYETTNIELNDQFDEYWVYTAVISICKDDIDYKAILSEVESDNGEEFGGFATVYFFEDEDCLKIDLFYISETKTYKRQWNAAVKDLFESYLDCYKLESI